MLVYKIVASADWNEAEVCGRFDGSEADRRDGFIHFSTAEQVRETAARHFKGQHGLVLVAVDATTLPLKWEPARGGQLFPHLYEPLPTLAVQWAKPLPLGSDATHVFPHDVPLPHH